jgi:hypothetical protein
MTYTSYAIGCQSEWKEKYIQKYYRAVNLSKT